MPSLEKSLAIGSTCSDVKRTCRFFRGHHIHAELCVGAPRCLVVIAKVAKNLTSLGRDDRITHLGGGGINTNNANLYGNFEGFSLCVQLYGNFEGFSLNSTLFGLG